MLRADGVETHTIEDHKEILLPHVIAEIVLALLVVSLLISRAVLKRRVDDLEKQLDDIRAGGVAPWANAPVSQIGAVATSASGDFMIEVERLVRANQLIQAIKLYRENTGMGLKESKDAVDALKRQMNL